MAHAEQAVFISMGILFSIIVLFGSLSCVDFFLNR